MIDQNGHLHCDKCGKEHALKLEGLLEWYCPRCKCYNKEKVKILDKQETLVVELK